ncbi:MAG: CNP1-like family protein [Betaproteobacteria bacterium]|nr:CNP1-like family protein [Betaproteobacteria bacterium]
MRAKRGFSVRVLAVVPGLLAVFVSFILIASPSLAENGRDIWGLDSKTYTVDGEDYDAKPWEEKAAELPPYPRDEDFYSFYVSAPAVNRFYVDTANISLGSDGVVRYALLIISPAGVRNVSYEGMRCQSRERRTYALGRPDNRWTVARGSLWVPVREATTNRHHAALFLDFFCPDGIMATRLEDVARAIRKQGEPLVKKR